MTSHKYCPRYPQRALHKGIISVVSGERSENSCRVSPRWNLKKRSGIGRTAVGTQSVQVILPVEIEWSFGNARKPGPGGEAIDNGKSVRRGVKLVDSPVAHRANCTLEGSSGSRIKIAPRSGIQVADLEPISAAGEIVNGGIGVVLAQCVESDKCASQTDSACE